VSSIAHLKQDAQSVHNQAAPVEPIKEKGYLETVEEKGAEDEEVVDAVGQTNKELVLFESNKHDADVTTFVNSLNELLLDKAGDHGQDSDGDSSYTSVSTLRDDPDAPTPFNVHKCGTPWEHICLPQWVSWQEGQKLAMREHISRMNRVRVLAFRDDKRLYKMCFDKHEMGNGCSPLSKDVQAEDVED